MTLIKCPSCEHTISSVASKCPRCGYLLIQPRFQQGHEGSGSLTECRKCGRKVLSKVRVCPYCGLNAPGRRSRVVALAAAGVIASALAILALQERMVSSQLFPADSGAAPGALPEEPAALPAAGVPSVPTMAAPANSLATIAPRDTVVTMPAAESLAAAAPSVDSVPSVPRQTRWASDWANIREARSLDALVVGIVRRGEAVQVANQAEGWYEVYRGGRFIGYVAADLLLAERPVIP